MSVKICHNCGENVISFTQKCPKCGVIPKKGTSPAVIAAAVIVVLLIVAVLSIYLF